MSRGPNGSLSGKTNHTWEFETRSFLGARWTRAACARVALWLAGQTPRGTSAHGKRTMDQPGIEIDDRSQSWKHEDRHTEQTSCRHTRPKVRPKMQNGSGKPKPRRQRELSRDKLDFSRQNEILAVAGFREPRQRADHTRCLTSG
jgi:hypothetical protein